MRVVILELTQEDLHLAAGLLAEEPASSVLKISNKKARRRARDTYMFKRGVCRVKGGVRMRVKALPVVLAVSVGLSRVLDMCVLHKGLAAAAREIGKGHVSKWAGE